MDTRGKVVMESILETKASTILEFFAGLRGTLSVTFEEGTWAGRDVYYTRHRTEWLGKIREAGVRRRAEQLYQQLDMLQHLRQQARRELLAESRKHPITAKLRKIPSLGPIRSALAVALIQTPHRFR